MDKTAPPIAELRRFASELIDKWAEAQNAANASVLKKAELAKQATIVKGQVTKKKKQLDEFMKKFEQPSLPGMEGDYRVRVLLTFRGGTSPIQGIELLSPEGAKLDNVSYEVEPGDVPHPELGAGGGPISTADAADKILKKADRVAPGADLPGQLSSLAVAEAGPVDLVVVVRQGTRKKTNETNHGRVTGLVGRAITKTLVETVTSGEPPVAAVCDLLHYRFEDHMDAQKAAEAVEEAGLKFVAGVTIDVAEDPPVGPAVEPIELEVQCKSLGVRLATQCDEIEAAVGAKAFAVEVNDDETGGTLYFDFDTIKDAFAAEGRVQGLRRDFVTDTFVGDPHEGRFSEAELDRLDAAPRTLVAYAPKDMLALRPTCSRCVALQHVFPGDEPVNAGLKADAECYFCGWHPFDNGTLADSAKLNPGGARA